MLTQIIYLMKSISALMVGAVCFGLLGVPVFGQVPVIFHATQTAAPGDIIGLQGGNFGTAPQVWMQHVIGTEPSLSPQVKLPLVNSSISNNYVASQIPKTESNGLYVNGSVPSMVVLMDSIQFDSMSGDPTLSALWFLWFGNPA
jgi:hypothetical protein